MMAARNILSREPEVAEPPALRTRKAKRQQPPRHKEEVAEPPPKVARNPVRGRGFDWCGVHFTRSSAVGGKGKERFQVRCPNAAHKNCTRSANFDPHTKDLVVRRLKYWLVSAEEFATKDAHMRYKFTDEHLPADEDLDKLGLTMAQATPAAAPSSKGSGTSSSSSSSSSSSGDSDSSAAELS